MELLQSVTERYGSVTEPLWNVATHNVLHWLRNAPEMPRNLWGIMEALWKCYGALQSVTEC